MCLTEVDSNFREDEAVGRLLGSPLMRQELLDPPRLAGVFLVGSDEGPAPARLVRLSLDGHLEYLVADSDANRTGIATEPQGELMSAARFDGYNFRPTPTP